MQISTIERSPPATISKKAAGVSPVEATFFWPLSGSAPLYEGMVRVHAVKRLMDGGAEARGKGIQALVRATDRRLHGIDGSRWNYTRRHSREVATLSYVIAREAGADQTLAFASGLAHDIGKTFLPRALLAKERGVEIGPLRILQGMKMTDIERNALRYGHIMLGSAYARLFWCWDHNQEMTVARDVIGLHHVTYDGLDSTHPSYPSGLRGKDLSLYCRIAKTADFVSAVRPRHYRPHYQEEWVLKLDDAVAYAIAVAGKELDPLTVRCLLTGMYEIGPLDADQLVRRLSGLPHHPGAHTRSHVEGTIKPDAEFAAMAGRRAHLKISKYADAICGEAERFGITMAPEFPE